MPRDHLLIYAAGFLRSMGVGALGVLFALALSAGGLDAGQIGFLVAVGIAGSACGTFFVSFFADQIGRKKTLILLACLSLLGGAGLTLFPGFLWLSAASFFGMVNAMGRERGALYTLEQAVLAHAASDSQRTKALAWYNVVLDVGQGVGSLLGGAPFLLRKHLGWELLASYQGTFAIYAGLGLAGVFLYMALSPQSHVDGTAPLPSGRQAWHKVSGESRRRITRLSLLFGFDSIAGGFLPSALIAYWFFKRFGVGEETIAPLFFFAHVGNAVSYLAAAWLAKKIGLVRTMVFTHMPANVCLMLIPFAPTLSAAAILYLVRECLVEMDVPTRQSYVMAVVEPQVRTMAAGVTNLTRLVAWTFGPTLSGLAMRSAFAGIPLMVGGGLKILYDISLYFSFRHIKPPEEQ